MGRVAIMRTPGRAIDPLGRVSCCQRKPGRSSRHNSKGEMKVFLIQTKLNQSSRRTTLLEILRRILLKIRQHSTEIRPTEIQNETQKKVVHFKWIPIPAAKGNCIVATESLKREIEISSICSSKISCSTNVAPGKQSACTGRDAGHNGRGRDGKIFTIIPKTDPRGPNKPKRSHSHRTTY
jgi:hypothetical protein